MSRAGSPLGASITLEQLDADPHPLLATLRARQPVSWIPVLDGWIVTSYELALAVMRDPRTFTVDDPRFSTARVIGPSMLSLDGPEHGRHREPFVARFRPGPVRARFTQATAREAGRLIELLRPTGAAELRRGFAGPLAASIIARALGLDPDEGPAVLAWYDAIVAAVTDITAGRGLTGEGEIAYAQLAARLRLVIDGDRKSSPLAAIGAGPELTGEEVISNAAVLLFGGVETTEGMIANAVLHLLERPDQLAHVRGDPALLAPAVEESLRLEPAAAVIDRYAREETSLGGVRIGLGELVRVSLAAANRDPAVFDRPDHFDLDRPNARRHLAFAHGPHVCVGVHLARLEAQTALAALLTSLPGLRLDPEHTPRIRGLVFRKPPALHVVWD